MRKFIIVGIYYDTLERFEETLEAVSSDEAEEQATRTHPGLVIAAVIEVRNGVMQLVA